LTDERCGVGSGFCPNAALAAEAELDIDALSECLRKDLCSVSAHPWAQAAR
jgi:hypothetical protein